MSNIIKYIQKEYHRVIDVRVVFLVRNNFEMRQLRTEQLYLCNSINGILIGIICWTHEVNKACQYVYLAVSYGYSITQEPQGICLISWTKVGHSILRTLKKPFYVLFNVQLGIRGF